VANTLNITNIPAPRVPFIDERTGLMAREWYRFFLNLFILTGSGNNPITLEELQLGPPNQPDFTELLIQINKDIAPQYEDQSGDFLKTLDTAQLMSMMSQFANAEAAIQGAYLQPVVQTGTIANYNLDGSPTAGGVAYGTGPALAVSAAGTLGQVLTSGGAGTPTWSAAATGTVTSVSVVSANGLAGTVATATTTPAITLSTTITGLLKGNGTAISAAASGTDYAPATSGTSILYGNGAGGFSNVTIGTGVAFAGGTLSATGSGGTVTSVTGTAPVVSSGGATPAISMAAATTSVNGYLTSTDWTTFNNKVTSVSGTAGRITSTGGATPVIDLASGIATAGTTGSASLIPVVTIDTYGRVTTITTAANPQGTVTSVTGTAPVVSSGGATPAISMAAATTSVSGYLTSTDWTTFNNKQPAGSYLVSGGALGTPSSGTVTNLTGTASININGTVGATTANTGAFTSLSSTIGANFATSSGNVGVGTASPVAKLGLVGGTSNASSLATAYSLAAFNITPKSTSGYSLQFGSGPSDFPYIQMSAGGAASGDIAIQPYGGNVGIGTTGPTGKLDVVGGRTFLAAASETFACGVKYVSTGGAFYFGAASSSATPDAVFSNSGGAERMRISNTGIVTMPAYGAGAATFSAAGVISSVSDETWKVKDGAPVDTDAMLNKLAPGYWYYNDEKKETFGADRQLGFYAQNVNAAIGPEAAPEPETVTTKNEDGTETSFTKPWGYYDRSVLAVTVMSLQKALATIESLTARITALETKG
jgi:hypothetical protein